MNNRVHGEEILDVVNMDDHVIGRATRKEVHLKSLVHRSVHVLVFNMEEKLYLQKRVWSKDENPGLWDSSASGHVNCGEEYLTCAHRELMEELGLAGEIQKKGRFKASLETAWEHVVIYSCMTKRKPVPDPSEILEGRFYEVPEIRCQIDYNSEQFTPTLKKIFKSVLK